ncbi:MAG: thiamine pyrophosphate-dependent dehydrogenase E1 component subunit alpha [Pseudomonadota bacterium]
MADDASSTSDLTADDQKVLLECYREMLRIRRVEERLSQLFADREIPGFIHLSIGQESVPVGVARHLTAADTIAVTHRGHGHALAKGMALPKFFAEMMGRDAGICAGRGGSMHIADASVGMLGANGIVAGGMSIATGSALAHKMDGQGNIAIGCFGDGALAEGIFHECLNLASLWSLPILFVCENNGWGEFSKTDQQFRGDLSGLATAFACRYAFADGTNVLSVVEVADKLIAGVRNNTKPAILECRVERFHGHFEGDPQKYRAEEELKKLEANDPLAIAKKALLANGIGEDTLEALVPELDEEIESAVGFANEASPPAFSDASADVYARSV